MKTGYISPKELNQALDVLAEDGAKIVAGGTDLMVQLRKAGLAGSDMPQTFLDVSGIPELNRIELNGPRSFLGAAVTFRTLETDERIINRYPALAKAASTVGSVQIRNLATIGGNIANASPAADGLTVLAAYGAEAHVASVRNTRILPLEELITGPNKTVLEPDELILGFQWDGSFDPKGQLFVKVGRRKAMVIARLNAAVCLDRELNDPRVVLGACFPSPRRLTEIEALVRSKPPGPACFREAGKMAADTFVHVCGRRSSAPYKVPAISRVVSRALETAWSRVEEKARVGENI